ncbi:MAG: RNA-binding S4 domain-containing protein [Bacilli bacterium]|jgi:ribosomal 50S subunit-recycling heat shock protein|nr:RNA-binding S4 domain-containing protein [Bacilli bacterium]MCH4211109.1 RNA-binding S4 domain-containing protein [Bacilli bacterium]MCH4229066.1 RNA-binding S4 domain-containing protein [Bacilli bacterium]MCH4278224.1 RNA-binding S4 domain-containing protein [Bacilli bacterium]
MRIDKFLKVSRLIKRRETAKELCDDGDVIINGKKAKAMSEILPNDTIIILLGRHKITAKVNFVKEFARKEEASTMYTILEDLIIERGE